ncbi:MAG: hypothetical protein M3137_00305, partial [Actinomycetota bacterium]|nr:hypothetical protein [Actinomycetota bacterium]
STGRISWPPTSYFYTYLGSTRATPAKAVALMASLPAAQQVLWVASPVPARAASNAPAQAAAYLDVIAAPGQRQGDRRLVLRRGPVGQTVPVGGSRDLRASTAQG